jgi:hypothetical protein
MPKLSGLTKGYLIWSLAVCLWLGTAFALGWKLPSLALGGFAGSRSGGGYAPYSSWSFGK